MSNTYCPNVLTALSRNRSAGDLVDQIQPVFQLYEQSFLSEKSLWYRKRPGKRTKAVPVLIREADSDADAAAQAAKLLRSEYGRTAIAAYVRGWLGDADIRYSKDLEIRDDKGYIMSLLAVLTSEDPTAGYQSQLTDCVLVNTEAIPFAMFMEAMDTINGGTDI